MTTESVACKGGSMWEVLVVEVRKFRTIRKNSVWDILQCLQTT